MPPQAMNELAHTLHAAVVDRDDPFVGRRLRSQASRGVRVYDYSKTRRMTGYSIEDRFTLTQKG
jgi:hypothetical protein